MNDEVKAFYEGYDKANKEVTQKIKEREDKIIQEYKNHQCTLRDKMIVIAELQSIRKFLECEKE